MGVGVVWGVTLTHMHMHAHARTCTCGKHDNFMQMAAPIGGISGIPYDVIRAYIQNLIALELIEIFQFCLKI